MFFADKGFKNEPKRCKNCKAKRAEGGGGGGETRLADALGNEGTLAMRERNDVPSGNAGAAGLLPRIFQQRRPWERHRTQEFSGQEVK